MNHDEKLGRMANQIADFFRPYPEEQAISGVYDHILAFWSPTMRRELLERIANDSGKVDPLVIAAFHALRTETSPTRKEAAGPAEVGEIGASDAG